MSANVPDVHHWLAGEEMNADRFNEVKAAIDFLRDPPLCHVMRNNSNQTLTANAWTKISFDTAVADPYGMWSAGSPDVITCQVPGWYTVEMVCSWSASATDERLLGGVFKNTFTALDDVYLRADFRNAASSASPIRREGWLFLNVGDPVYLGQHCPSARTTLVSAPNQPRLRLRWISR